MHQVPCQPGSGQCLQGASEELIDETKLTRRSFTLEGNLGHQVSQRAADVGCSHVKEISEEMLIQSFILVKVGHTHNVQLKCQFPKAKSIVR